jgi:DNA-binding transcriptional LysR family regulator
MSNDVELSKLRNLIAISDAGNISIAARGLYLSQPALSVQMRRFEDALGIPLLVRNHKGVRTTPGAEILITGGREVMKILDELISTARALHQAAILPMRLGFSSFVDHGLFEMVCSIHKALFPNCPITPKSGDNVALLALLGNGDIDAAVLTLPASGRGLKAYPFAKSRLVLCMKADDPLARLKEIAPSELRGKLTIFQDPKQHPEAHQRLMEMLDEVGAQCAVVSTTETPLDIQWMVGSGHGYALIREGSIAQKGLVTRPIAGVTWTVDSALIVGPSISQKTVPQLVRELRKRARVQALLPPPKPVRSVRPSIAAKTLPLFG